MSTDITVIPDVDIDLSTLTRERILQGVSDELEHLKETGDIERTVRVIAAFGKFEDLSGIGKAYTLWGSQQWFTTTHQEGDFYEKFGITEQNARTYVDRLIRMWDCLQSGKVPPKVARRTVRELLPITEALSQNYEIDTESWKKLEQAIDVDEIRAIVQQEIKKKEPRSHTLSFTVDSKGTITMWYQGEGFYAGMLNVVDAETNEVLAKGINRIVAGNAKMKRIS